MRDEAGYEWCYFPLHGASGYAHMVEVLDNSYLYFSCNTSTLYKLDDSKIVNAPENQPRCVKCQKIIADRVTARLKGR